MLGRIKITELFVHEDFDLDHAVEVAKHIEEFGLENPIIVDGRTLIVLDGHHRMVAYKILGRYTIPAIFIDLMDPKVVIEWRRREYQEDTKETIIARALSGKPYPPKTTRIFKVDDNGNLRKLKEMF